MPESTSDDSVVFPVSREAPMDCVNCGMVLPIEINHTHDDSESLACNFCGERYRGVYRPESAPAAADNVIRYG